MKTIGLLGGMSWESSLTYYRLVNEEVKRKLGGFHSAKCLMYSVDFDEIESYQSNGEWDKATKVMIDAARSLEKGGAEFVVICTNTMHKMFAEVQAAVGIPLLHIVDAVANEIQNKGIHSVGLLGTRFTMEEDFYVNRIKSHELDVLTPPEEDRKTVHRVIYQELVMGKILPESREEYKKIIHRLEQEGAQGVILGCTEIGLLIKPDDVSIPIFDTTYWHALAAVRIALGEIKMEEFLPR